MQMPANAGYDAANAGDDPEDAADDPSDAAGNLCALAAGSAGSPAAAECDSSMHRDAHHHHLFAPLPVLRPGSGP